MVRLPMLPTQDTPTLQIQTASPPSSSPHPTVQPCRNRKASKFIYRTQSSSKLFAINQYSLNTIVSKDFWLFFVESILKGGLTQFAYLASLREAPFEEFSCVLLFLLRLSAVSRLLLVADNQCTEGSPIPRDPGYYIPHPLRYPCTSANTLPMYH